MNWTIISFSFILLCLQNFPDFDNQSDFFNNEDEAGAADYVDENDFSFNLVRLNYFPLQLIWIEPKCFCFLEYIFRVVSAMTPSEAGFDLP